MDPNHTFAENVNILLYFSLSFVLWSITAFWNVTETFNKLRTKMCVMQCDPVECCGLISIWLCGIPF